MSGSVSATVGPSADAKQAPGNCPIREQQSALDKSAASSWSIRVLPMSMPSISTCTGLLTDCSLLGFSISNEKTYSCSGIVSTSGTTVSCPR